MQDSDGIGRWVYLHTATSRFLGISVKTRRDMLKAAAIGAPTPFLPDIRREAQVPPSARDTLRLCTPALNLKTRIYRP